jgi:UDP-glucose 4-epimerase
MKENKLKILITGARGFIGKNLTEYLQEECAGKYEVYGPRHADLELLDSEKVSEFIQSNNIEVIVHCASVGGTRRTGYDQDKTDVVYKNLAMFFNLAQNLDSKRRMVVLGSGAEYDLRNYQPRMVEDYFGAHIPADAYGFSKYACSKYIEKAENLVDLRLFAVYGKHEDYEYRFISNAIVKNLLGLPIVINQNVYFDFLYIEDLVRILEYFIGHKPKHKFYNVATGQTADLLTIAREINRISGKPSEIIVKNDGLNTEYSADNARLLREIRGLSFTPREKALERLHAWHKNNLSKVNLQAIEKDEYIRYCRTKT